MKSAKIRITGSLLTTAALLLVSCGAMRNASYAMVPCEGDLPACEQRCKNKQTPEDALGCEILAVLKAEALRPEEVSNEHFDEIRDMMRRLVSGCENGYDRACRADARVRPLVDKLLASNQASEDAETQQGEASKQGMSAIVERSDSIQASARAFLVTLHKDERACMSRGIMDNCGPHGRLAGDAIGLAKDAKDCASPFAKVAKPPAQLVEKCAAKLAKADAKLGEARKSVDEVVAAKQKEEEAKSQAEAPYRLQCDGGDLAGCVALGKLQWETDRTVTTLDSACDRGSAEACKLMAHISRGGGTLAATASYHTKWVNNLIGACNRNVMDACSTLVEWYLDGDEDFGRTDEAVADDVPKAFPLAKKACDGGDNWGCYFMGRMHRDGKSAPKDQTKAKIFFSKACTLNNGPGCTAIGNTEKGCTLGHETACNARCRSGNTAACAKASKEVAAEARFPALIAKCEANRVIFERRKVAVMQAAQSGASDKATRAQKEFEEFQPTFGETLAELQEAIQLISGGENPKLGQLAVQVRNRCSCAPDPNRPGGWCRRW